MNKTKIGKIILYVSVICAVIVAVVNKFIIPMNHTIYYPLILVFLGGTIAGWLVYSEGKNSKE